MKFLNNMKKCKLFSKLHSGSGITMVETLAAVAILSLLAMMLSTGLFMAQDSYRQMTAEAETQLLLSTVSNIVSNELRYARDVDEENGILQKYTSISYGRNTTISINDEGHLVSNERDMLSSGVYENGEYKISQLIIKYEKNGIFNVFIRVEDRFGVSAETEFSINCLNES